MTDRMAMADNAQLQQDRIVEAREEAYRELARENSKVSVPDDARVQTVGEEGAWVTVQHWIPGWLMRDYLRQPHNREAGL